MLRQAGFQQVSSPVVQLIENNMTGETVFDSYFLRKESCSQFILLTDEVYQAGLARMHVEVEQAKVRGKQVVFRTRLKDRIYHGFKDVFKVIGS